MATKQFYASNSWYRPGATRWDGPLSQKVMGGKNASGKDYRALLYFGGLTSLNGVSSVKLHVYRANDGYSTADKTWLCQIANGKTATGEVSATASGGTHTLKTSTWNILSIPVSSWPYLLSGKYLHFYSTSNNQYAEIYAHNSTQYRPYLTVEYRESIIPGKPPWASVSPALIEPFKTVATISWGAATNAVSYEVERYTGSWVRVGTFTTYSVNETITGAPGTQIQYRVRACSSTGDTSAWTLSNTSVLNTPPEAPIVEAPQNGGVTYRANIFVLVAAGDDEQTQTVSGVIEDLTAQKSGMRSGDKTVLEIGPLQNGTFGVSVKAIDMAGGESAAQKREFQVSTYQQNEEVEKGKPIQANHILSLLEAVDNLRLYYGVSQVVWPSDIFPGERIKATHIYVIRNALEEVIAKVNEYEPGTIEKPSWAYETLEGRPIRPDQIQELVRVIQSL